MESKGKVEHFITLFKLHLAGSEKTSAANLPRGLTPRRTISDYLRKISKLIINVLHENLGNHINMEDLQWCITVPTIWDEQAKQEMKACAEIAGLVLGPHCKDMDASPHPAIIVLEPEAASFYCQQKSGFPLNDGDKFLVVDAGGGTVDLALHEKVGPPWSKKVREEAPSSGGLCGGTYVDERFFEFLGQKIKCFRRFAEGHSQTVLKLQSWWETVKCEFDSSIDVDYELDLTAKLARAWEEDDASNGGSLTATSYDSITVTLADLRSIFDLVVDQILQLIEEASVPDLKVMMVVGGFSGSPYLKERITAAFSQKMAAGTIIFPKEPGSAICCGAVAYGISEPDLMMSRISKKTYGVRLALPFRQGDPEHLKILDADGYSWLCSKRFDIFTRRGETVAVDSCVSKTQWPIRLHQTEIQITMVSTSDANPTYVTDPGVAEEGSFIVNCPSKYELGELPKVKVSMYFGRTMIEVKAVGENFGEGEDFVMPPVAFEGSFKRLS